MANTGESLFNEGFSEYNLREVCSGFTNVIVLSLNLLRCLPALFPFLRLIFWNFNSHLKVVIPHTGFSVGVVLRVVFDCHTDNSLATFMTRTHQYY